ncbi:MAG: thiol peroxidase [Lagierella massiliensis]|nr:thiol peroxidase [Lagierella massiliensis]
MKTTFGNKPVTIIGEQVKVGDLAPEFKAVNTDLSVYNSTEDKGKVVVYSVVPSVDTPVCDIQTRTFNEKVEELGKDVKIITISVDLPFAQQRYCASKGIENVVVVSDYNGHDFGKKYGFLMEENMLLQRGIIIVDRDGKITYTEYVSESTNAVDFDKAFEEIKKLN